MLDNVRLQSDLLPGETLEWAGKPDPGRIFTATDWFMIPFSLVWGGVFIPLSALLVLHGDQFSKLLGSIMLLWALTAVFGRFPLSAWDLRHTWYGVTNQRIVILTTTFGHRIQSFYFSMLPEIETRISASGRGTLRFGPPPSYHNFGTLIGGTHFARAPGFYDIPDARYVFALINRQRSASP